MLCYDLSCGSQLTYSFSESGIAWPEDAAMYGLTQWATSTDPTVIASIPTQLIPPPMWRKAWPSRFGNGYNQSNLPDLNKWERFQVWMRKSGLPTFRKLWGRNTDSNLNAGNWEVPYLSSHLIFVGCCS